MKPNFSPQAFSNGSPPQKDERPEPTQKSVSGTDVTIEKLRQRNAELEKINSELASFAYVASHDLQEPLRKIQMFSKRILEKENLTEEGQQYFDRIDKAALRMQMLIRTLLDYSGASRSHLEKEDLDLNEAWEDAVNSLKDKIDEKSAMIQADALPSIKASHVQIHQLFTNLISNSLKFCKPVAPVAVHLSCSRISSLQAQELGLQARPYIKLIMKDNGIGFESQYAEQIFGLFQRLHSTSEYPGTGLGLSICRKIVENHGGRIFAESGNGRGATFNIYLPGLDL